MTAWPIIRLLLAVFSLAIAVPAITPTPTVPLFKLALGATEFGHRWVLLPLLLLALGPWDSPLGFSSVVLSLAASALLLSAALQAQRLARTLPDALAGAFPFSKTAGGADGRPFTWRALWFTPRTVPVPIEVREFAGRDGARLSFHFYRSQQRPPAPCVIVIHGGGWEGGSPGDFAALNHRLARCGYAVAAIEYRFAPRWPWPAQREDVLDALHCLKGHAEELGIDPAKFVILGRSAGGQIAQATAYFAHDPAIRGCIALYAPADMHFAHEFARDDDILSTLGIVSRFMGGTPATARANYDSGSGIRLAARTCPPTLLLHGRRDPLVWYLQSQRLAARLRAHGVPHYYLDLSWATHGFDFNPHGPAGQLSAYAVEHFLAAVTL